MAYERIPHSIDLAMSVIVNFFVCERISNSIDLAMSVIVNFLANVNSHHRAC
jgi:hypothetical protein